MTRFILENELSTSEALAAFSYEGFEYRPGTEDSDKMIFIHNLTK
jgi:cytoplasmic iron level regulating protein YaaA (DUF328/UPF0246 family)